MLCKWHKAMIVKRLISPTCDFIPSREAITNSITISTIKNVENAPTGNISFLIMNIVFSCDNPLLFITITIFSVKSVNAKSKNRFKVVRVMSCHKLK